MRTLAAFAILLLVAACQAPPAEMTEAEMAQIEAEAKQAIQSQWEKMISGGLNQDWEAYLSCWTSDLQVLEPGVDVTGMDQFREHVNEVREAGMEVLGFERKSREISVHGDVAYEMGRYKNTVQFPGGEPMEMGSNYFAKWKKGEDGVWRTSRLVAGPIEAPPQG
jgi:ketosteroid isomerase-like protein